jgi:hypothetical protein
MPAAKFLPMQPRQKTGTTGVLFPMAAGRSEWRNSAAAGETFAGLEAVVDGRTPAGTYDMWLADIAFVSLDGTVTPLYNGQTG